MTSIDIHKITVADVERILKTEEGHFHDLKAIDVQPAKLTKSLSAFANAAGGELFVGIDEKKLDGTRAWRGFARVEDANGHIQALEALFPLGAECEYHFFECAGHNGYVLHLDVKKSRDIKKASDGTAYVRRGAQNLPQKTEEELKRLRLNKGIVSFEGETTNAPVSVITNSIPVLKFITTVVPHAEPEDWLRKQLLLHEGRPTVAGVLLFAEEPQAVLPKRCAIKIYRYATNAEDGTRETLAFDPITIEGCLYDQINSAVAKVVEIIEHLKVATPTGGYEDARYPHTTLHEIITNAALHRDYSIPSDIHVRIFDNRIEVDSPGKLPGHVTVKNILSEQFARNPAIVRLINKFPDPPNKDVGEGLNAAFEAMREMRLKEPVISEHENVVRVDIRHEPLATPEQTILDYLRNNATITNRIAREICYIGSENRIKRILQKLVRQGHTELVPGTFGKSTAYQLKKNATGT